MTNRIFVTKEGEELDLETCVQRLMRTASALEALVKEQDILVERLADRVNCLENTILDTLK